MIMGEYGLTQHGVGHECLSSVDYSSFITSDLGRYPTADREGTLGITPNSPGFHGTVPSSCRSVLKAHKPEPSAITSSSTGL